MADKIILKRSSILGKRPSNQVIQPGEVALNTNSDDPGAFFEVSDGNVVKIGPTSVSPVAPVQLPEKGEMWYDTVKGTLSVGVVENAKKVWKAIATPYLGGSNTVIFVAPDFYGSTDSITNDGQALPYQSLTRGLVQIAKNKIYNYLSNNGTTNATEKYVIQFAPSVLPVDNSPGVSVENFSVNLENGSIANIPISDLIQFNPLDGGVIIPGNVSVKGFELKKCEIKPTYVPSYTHPGYPASYAGTNQPLSSIFKVAGNVTEENFSITDKVEEIRVTQVSLNNNYALFRSASPHGLSKNDLLDVVFAPNVDQSTGTFVSGPYYADPLDAYTFYLSSQSLTEFSSTGTYILYTSLPSLPADNQVKFTAVYTLKSAHRLAAFRYASFQELSDYYTKVQKAFPAFFGGQVTDGAKIVNSGEYILVAPTDNPYPDNLTSNSTKSSSCYIRQVNLRSDYGMNLGDFNGDDVQGFRSLIANECTSVSLQKDPAAYEIYTTITNPSTGLAEQKWWTLAEATYYSLPAPERPATLNLVPWSLQLQTLNQTPIEKIRYYYDTLRDSDGKSFGILDVNNDFRHFGIRARNSAYVQAQSIYTIGCAVGVWSLGGAIISLTNSTSNFGSVAFKSEGFRGINTIGGAYTNAKGFLFNGIQRPLSLSESQILDIENKSILSLGSRIIDSYVDPSNPAIQILSLSSSFLPCYILPFSLKPGSAVWVSSSQCTFRGFLATDGGPTVILGSEGQCDQTAKLRIRYSDSTIPSDSAGISSLDIPYIRRFKDPRNLSDRTYQFVVSNTSAEAVAPGIGSVLRLNQSSQTQGAASLKPNVQFDPGALGGWGRLFTVDSVQTSSLGSSPNYNYVVSNNTQDSRYLLTLTAGDTASPWLQTKVNQPQGTFCTYLNRNWYAAENNEWQSVYYDATFSKTIGPHKIAPTENCSPYVVTSTLEKQELVENSYQGPYAADPNLTTLTDTELSNYKLGTYFRGSTLPYTCYSIQNYFDDDDGTDGMGMLLKEVTSGYSTVLVSSINAESVITQPTLPPDYGSLRTAPEIVEFYVLSSADIENPKQTMSVLKIQQGSRYEYLQVINLVGTRVTAIRLDRSNSYYPNPVGGLGDLKPVWNVGTVDPPVVNVCITNEVPSILTYDPEWSSSKQCVYRFFQVMGYGETTMSRYLQPQYWGERFFSIGSLSDAPGEDGYALITASWPLEFNQPSTIIANTHTWAYCGYPFYSQGLPKYQTNDISRKLSYDFLSTAVWSGRLTVTGVNDDGEIVSFGPQREAVTSQYHEQELPTVNVASKQMYKDQPIVEFPGQVVVYTTDDISQEFDGSTTGFLLTKGGINIPSSHLTANSVWVQLGGITQIPNVHYTISVNTISFIDAPAEGTTCDIRVVTSEDNEKTLIVVPLILETSEMGDNRSIFSLTSDLDISNLSITTFNTIVIMGGVEQLPSAAYSIERLSATEVQITFTGVPPGSSTVDIRAICSGSFWSSQGIEPVAVYSLDDISPEFSNLGQTTFLLTYGGQPVNPALVNTENLLVSIGGAMQVPLGNTGNAPAGAYKVALNADNQAVIILQESPLEFATSDLRVITNAEFLPCENGRGYSGGFLKWGPSVVLNLVYDVNELKG
jgi:hypothetical protein